MAGREWLVPTVLLCLHGFFKEMRPSEPFLTAYLVQNKNISVDVVDNQIYPVWTYSYMIALIPVFLFTDILRYKPVIIFEGCALLATYALLLWAYGVSLMKLMQLFFGLTTATEIAYYSYIYPVVSPEHYQRVSSYVRSMFLMGRFVNGVLGQLLYSLSKNADILYTLNVISMGSVSVATVISLFLPKIESSTYFHRRQPEIQDDANTSSTHTPEKVETLDNGRSQDHVVHDQADSRCGKFLQACRDNFNTLWLDFKTCYSNKHLLKWSLWWAFATCGFFQVVNYMQNLWQVIFDKSDTDVGDVYNGAVEATSTLFGAAASFSVMFTKINWDLFGEMLLGLISVIDAILLVSMATTDNIWVCYSFYVLFNTTYQLVITIATYQIAKHLTVQRYALVFGCNMFVALVLQSLLTVIVVDYRTLNAPPELQYLIYSGCFFVLGVLFSCKATYSITVSGWIWSWRNRYETVEPDVDGNHGSGELSDDCFESNDGGDPQGDQEVNISDERPLVD